ncbi:MAG: tRNA 2-selenouridine(34) synthase MnmH [Pseudomonadota bacterium]
MNSKNEQLLYQLFTKNTPLMDVRAPIEFTEGAFPMASNYPLLNDLQRHEIGIKYKQAGQDEAIKLGLKLAGTTIKQQRIDSWSEFIRKNPDAYLYCFRGGLRSKTTQQWLRNEGINIPLIEGGYKAMRRYLLEQLEQQVSSFNFYILGGQTGTGKTEVLQHIKNSVDLEGLANHRGSSFGSYVKAQPSQINFENNLAIELLKKHQQQYNSIVLEDEGFLIGHRLVPKFLFEKMKQMPLIVLQRSIQERVSITLNDYIISNYQDYLSLYKDNANEVFKQDLKASLDRIKKRLGGQRHKFLASLMDEAIQSHFDNNDFSGYQQVIKLLMLEYYDPMYQYQLDKKQDRVIFKGNEDEVLLFISKISDE